jgi:iron complex transport system permease protein
MGSACRDPAEHDRERGKEGEDPLVSVSAASGSALVRTGAVRVRGRWLIAGASTLALAATAGTVLGAVSMPPGRVLVEVLDHIPGIRVESGLSRVDATIVWQLRLPRVMLGLLVGCMLASAGSAYQGVFRNPLADPYLLGVSAGAGVGVTIAVVTGATWEAGPFDTIQLAAFVGAIGAVGLTYMLASVGGPMRSTSVLLLAGVAVSAFLLAIQTFLLQRHADSIRDVYNWITGSLSTSGWAEVRALVPYAIVTTVVLVLYRRALDVLAVGDDEAAALGLNVGRTRLVVVATASLATAAAVSVSGLVGFVGIIVPHVVRMVAGTSYRVILPLSLLFGGAFLALADLMGRTLLSPAEVPIGVVTAFVGAPFFAVVLRTRQGATL